MTCRYYFTFHCTRRRLSDVDKNDPLFEIEFFLCNINLYVGYILYFRIVDKKKRIKSVVVFFAKKKYMMIIHCSS